MRQLDGAAVEEMAEQLFPDRVRIGAAVDTDEEAERRSGREQRIEATREALDARRSIVQAHLQADDLLAISDVLEPRGTGWFVWEVKSSSYDPVKGKIKALYEWDLAFQVHLARLCGLEVVGAGLLLLDKAYERGAGPIDPDALIVRLDRTREVFEKVVQVEQELAQMRAALEREASPTEWPAPRCRGSRDVKAGNRPSTCGHLEPSGECGRQLPKYWVGRLPDLRGAKSDYVASTRNLSIDRLDPEDDGFAWSAPQQRVIRAVQAGGPEIDAVALRQQLDRVEWPVAYLDFEFDPSMGVPRFEGSHPYDRVPFQWAMSVQAAPDAALEEREPFLWLEPTDPSLAFATSLLAAVPTTGSIIAHHKSAETSVLESVAGRVEPNLARGLRALIPRFLDSKDIAAAGYYHPDQQGSYSIKKLAPCLTGLGYDDLAISNGLVAVTQWRRAIDSNCPLDERVSLQHDLLAYCGRDAALMHAILEELRRLSGWRPQTR